MGNTVMKSRYGKLILTFALLSSLSIHAAAQKNNIRMYNTIALEGSTARWTGKDMNVATFRLAPGILLGGHWIAFLPVGFNIDMYNIQSSNNFQFQLLTGAGAGYGQDYRNGCFWDATYSWSTTLLAKEMNYQQQHLNIRLGVHTLKGDLFCQAGVILRSDRHNGESLWMPAFGLGIRL